MLPDEGYRILDYVHEYIFIVDKDCKCVFANVAACQHFRLTGGYRDFLMLNVEARDRDGIRSIIDALFSGSACGEPSILISVKDTFRQFRAVLTKPSEHTVCIHLKSEPSDDNTGALPRQVQRTEIEQLLSEIDRLTSTITKMQADQFVLEQLLASQRLLAQFATDITSYSTDKEYVSEMLEDISTHMHLDRISISSSIFPNQESCIWSRADEQTGFNLPKYYKKNLPDFIIGGYHRGWPDQIVGPGGSVPRGAVIGAALYGSKGYSGFLQAEKHSIDADWSDADIDFFFAVKAIFETKIQFAESHAELIGAKEMAEIANLAKSEFLANISHEIRTPLNAMLGYSQVIMERGIDPESKYAAASILKNGSALLDLLNDIIELSKIEAGVTEYPLAYTSIPDLFEKLEQLFSSTAETKSMAYQLQYDRSMPCNLLVNAILIKQILVSLIGNAFKFSSAGSVTVTAWSTHDGNEIGDLFIEIKDTGIGISEKTRTRIFEPFFQNEPVNTKSFSGVGLGLTIVNKLLGRIGGSIDVSSTFGRGSTFTVRIPDVLGDITNGSLDSLNEKITNFRKNTPEILIISDRDILVNYIRDFFSESDSISQLSGSFNYEEIPFDYADVIIIDRQSKCAPDTELMLMQWKSTSPACVPVCIAVSPANNSSLLMYDGYFWLPIQKKQIHKELVRLMDQIKEVEFSRDEQSCKSGRCSLHVGSDLYAELQNEAMPITESLSEGIILNDVDKLVAILFELGDRYQSQWCLQTGQKLADALQAFDLFRIDAIIAEFEKGMKQAW